MKLRPDGFKKVSKRGLIDPIRQIQGKNYDPKRDPKRYVRETRDELGSSRHGLAMVPA